jgi:hypothetical protein
MKRAICLWAVLVGCGDDSTAPADAAVDASAIDAAIDAPAIDASNADAGPLCGASDGGAVGMHKLFFNFEAVTITHGGIGCQDDATRNCSFIATMDTMVPQFASGMGAGRQAFLDAIVAAANQILAPYSVEVVATRPAAGPYTMIVFAQCVSTLMCSAGGGAIAPDDCMNANPNDIAFVFEQTSATAAYYANLAIFDYGLTLGVSTNQLAGDCLCDNCGTPTLCSLSTDSVIHQSACNPNQVGTHQNEQSMFSAALGCRF